METSRDLEGGKGQKGWELCILGYYKNQSKAFYFPRTSRQYPGMAWTKQIKNKPYLKWHIFDPSHMFNYWHDSKEPQNYDTHFVELFCG